jgi:phospholipid/cholesterol/gamma-HCH transport system ATP-binding protein
MKDTEKYQPEVAAPAAGEASGEAAQGKDAEQGATGGERDEEASAGKGAADEDTPDEASEEFIEKSQEQAQAEREERQVQADEQAEALRKAEEASQETLAKSGGEPVIVIKGLRKAFGDHEVLRGVDLHVNKGENLVILGKSGTGKSVLIKCLVGLEWPDEGEITMFGKEVVGLDYRGLTEVRLRTGFLFQNAALYDSMTVRENLLFPLRQLKKDMTREKKQSLMMEMLDNVGLVEAIDQLPSKLSGGQSKRIGLARTLILQPELMLYDEPTTGLDTGTAKEISELMILTKKKYNISSITITHDMHCAKMTADRIIMMKEGVVVAEGTYEELEKSEDEWIRSFFY